MAKLHESAELQVRIGKLVGVVPSMEHCEGALLVCTIRECMRWNRFSGNAWPRNQVRYLDWPQLLLNQASSMFGALLALIIVPSHQATNGLG